MSAGEPVSPGPRPAPALLALEAYRPARPAAPCDLRLDGNEGAVPPADIIQAALGSVASLARRYPTPASLAPALARLYGTTADRVLVTAGADDALDRVCRAMLAPGRNAVIHTPTFEMIERYVVLAGGAVRAVTWEGGAFPLESMRAAIDERTALVFVVSPNNPTGAVASGDDIVDVAEAAPQALVVADLAYVDFADHDPTARLLAQANVVVTRTLSKAWGLAGLRVGVALGDPRVISWLSRVGQPYAVSGPSLAIAEAWIEKGAPHVSTFVERARAERGAIADALSRHGYVSERSQANFVLARGADPAWLQDGLAGLGIAVRRWPDRPGVGDAVRITCPGNERDLDRLVRAIDIVLAPEALLFDLDGVLADVSGSYRAAIRATCAHYGVAVTAADIAAIKAAGHANNDWIVSQRLLARAGVMVPIEDVISVFEDHYQGSALRPGLREAESPIIDANGLTRLARGLPVAIVTGRPRSDARRFLERHGFDAIVKALVCLEDAPQKPDPGPVRLALLRLGVSRAWMIGDTPDDVRAARDAGVVPLGVIAPGDDQASMHEALFRAGAARVLATVNCLNEVLP